MKENMKDSECFSKSSFGITEKYKQSYKISWKEHPLFNTWLCRNYDDKNLAYSKCCKRSIYPKKSNISECMKTSSHINMNDRNVTDENREISIGVKKAEIKLCAAIVQQCTFSRNESYFIGHSVRFS